MCVTAITIADDQIEEFKTVEAARAYAEQWATENPGEDIKIFTLAEVKRGTITVQNLTPAQYQAEAERTKND